MATRNELKLKFKTGSIPTEEDFAVWMDSIAFQNEDGIIKSKSTPLEIRVDEKAAGELIRFSSFFNSQENRLKISMSTEKDDADWSFGNFNNLEFIRNDNYGIKIRNRYTDWKEANLDFSEIQQIFQQPFVSKYNKAGDLINLKSIIGAQFGANNENTFKSLYVMNKTGTAEQAIWLSATLKNDQTVDSEVILISKGSKKDGLGLTGESAQLSIKNNALTVNISPVYGAPKKMFEITKDAVKALGTIQPIGNDFAELFESENGKKIPVGTSIVITEKGLIRATKKGEIPVGVVSAVPGILGGNYDEWPQKYLKDEYGHPIYEEAEIEAASERSVPNIVGKSINYPTESSRKKQEAPIRILREKLNPDYDPAREYIPRSQRPEWHPVGLLGQLHLRKGQPVSPTWVKIKDVSENVELWLVK